MVYYSFYTDSKKTNLVYRTENLYSHDKEDGLVFFEDKKSAELDFYSLLFDNPCYRISEYFDTEVKVKKASRKKAIPVKKNEDVKKDRVFYEDVSPFNIYNEDCMETMKRMPDGYVDMVITSPPYNAGNRSGIGDDMYNEYDDNQDSEYYEEWLFSVIDELLRVTKKHIFFNIQQLAKNKRTILKLQGKYNENIKDTMIWKKKIVPPHIQPGIMNSGFEFIFVMSNQRPELKKFDDARFSQGSFSNVIEGMNASSNEYAKYNHATFPLYLPRTILNAFGKIDELVYDPFTGTGTTQIACIIENRKWIGSEMDADQCSITAKRLYNESIKNPIKF